MSDTTIHGTCDPRFARVKDAFAEGFRTRDEIGAAVALTIDGKPVVDLWAGHADLAKTRPWERDTIVNVYSTTKGMAALCLHQLVDEGRVDLDAPVARYWPEFEQAGKGSIPVRFFLGHRSGLAAARPLLPSPALYDWDAMVTALAAQEPWWEPGTAHGYHAVTFGWLVGEVVRRVTGKSLGTYFRDAIARPLGMDFHIGLHDEEHGRVAEMSPIPLPEPGAETLQLGMVILSNPGGLSAQAFMNPPSIGLGVNYPEWRRAEIPGANGHGDARSLARVYGALARGGSVDGVTVLSTEGVARCHAELSHGPDLVLMVNTRFGHGYMLSQDRKDASFGPGTRSFGHPGAGGSLGFADPDAKLGFGYVMNRMGPNIILDPRATALLDAVYASL
ncbi:MAG TPA: serine hydrolase domain-containing protein [Candidatus Eisenbacteria bacterium]|nr:serine hydrolase domain-containing protein [Candidatus Eisenbacteria bacterium]